MSRYFGTGDGGETSASPPSEALHFARALVGNPVPSPWRERTEARANRERSEWLAKVSPEHESGLRTSLREHAAATAERQQLEWLARISPTHEGQLGRLSAAEAKATEAAARVERLVEYSDVWEAQWDPAKHPRRGGPPNAGWFATTGGAGRSGASARKPNRTGTNGKPDSIDKDAVPPEMLELASAWWQTDGLLQQYRRDIERLPKRVASERAQLGRGGRYAYIHKQNLAKAKKDLETANAQMPELEAQLRDLKQRYRDSGYDDVAYSMWTAGENFVGGRGIEQVGRAVHMAGTPVGVKSTGIEFDVALAAVSVFKLGKLALSKALTKSPGNVASKAATLKPYGGAGGGHHVPAKSAFKGAAAYDAKAALAIPNKELARLNVRHAAVTGAQKRLYRELVKTGANLTWEEVERIEIAALVRGGLNSDMARATVKQAIDSLKNAGVPSPTRIPWGN